MNILVWIKAIAVGLSIGLLVGGIGGYKICSSGMWKAVVKDQVKQAVGVNLLHKGELKDATKTSETIRYIKSAPDATKCIPVRMRAFDIDALGGVQYNGGKD